MKKKNFLIIILAMVMVFTTTLSVQAAVSWPSISSSKPIKAYTISTGNNTTAYSNSNLNSKIGTIYASDELYIQSIGKNSAGKYYCKLTYPTSNGRKTAYTPLSIVTNATSPSGQYKATGSITTYRRASSSSKAGSIANGDTVYKLSTSGSYVQVLYNIGSASNPSGWRMAWITTSNFNQYVKAVGSNPEGYIDSVSSNNAGQITVRGWAFDKDNLSANLPIHVYVGGAAGSGAPGYAITANTYRPDVNTVYSGVGNYHGYESTFNVSRTGKQTIYIYACNVGGGNNVLLGTKTIDIKSNNTTSSNQSNTSTWQMPMNNSYCTWRSKESWSWATYTNNSSNRDYHIGIDIYGTNGTVYAASNGKVVAASSSTSGANGRYIIIEHTISGKTVYSFYAHLSSVNVSVGQSITKGTQIGVAGGSGYGSNSYYGTHLHFAIVDTLWSNGSYYGYATKFTGDKVNYSNVTYYNPIYVINNNKLP